jgi:hypothetical protein
MPEGADALPSNETHGQGITRAILIFVLVAAVLLGDG